MRRALHISFAANVVLLAVRVGIAVVSGSLSLMVATLDAVLDVVSSFIVWFTTRQVRRQARRWLRCLVHCQQGVQAGASSACSRLDMPCPAARRAMQAKRRNKYLFPVGKERMEPLGIIVFRCRGPWSTNCVSAAG